MSTDTLPARSSDTTVTGRSLAPDLARGFMLLLIAFAHAPAFVSDGTLGPAPLNAAATFLKSLLADNQARDMFIFLFGYGLGQLAYRDHTRGHEWTDTRKLLRRRALWLVVIGFANTVFLVPIDVIAIYGLTLLALAPLVRARDSVLLWTSGLTLIPATVLLAWQSVGAQVKPVTMAAYMEPTLGLHLVSNIAVWPAKTIISTVMVVPAMLIGVWAARRRLLDEPERNVRLLRHVTVIGLAVALIGRLPAALLAVGAWSTPSPAVGWTIAISHDATGYVGGLGLAAAVGLVATKVRGGRVTTALAALGQRSLTFYLFQAVVWVTLFYPFALDLSGAMGAAATFAIAAAVWLLSIVLADGMRVIGYRGPAELFLRRMSGKQGPRAPQP
ncbi:DUF418 domain-containing protein [Streptosporangiaceae bacterium NEAU-GS5]|nr:DUF418 domain-containing protein [Streptosporangiaceae bacterium NEAU-GS5]